MLLEPTEQRISQKPWPTIGGKSHEASFLRIALHHGLSGEQCLGDLEHLICLVHTSKNPGELIERWKKYRLKAEEDKQLRTNGPEQAKRCAERKVELEFEEYKKIGSMTRNEVILNGMNDTFSKDMMNLFYNINVDGLRHLNCRELSPDVKEHLEKETERVQNTLRDRLDSLGLDKKPVSTGLCQVIVAVANRDKLPARLQEKIFGV
ncbi:MAG: hypothetical protein WCX64_05690 [Candidatus Micrarchaeia archaeon]